MSGKEQTFLVWDASDCPAQNIAFISKISKLVKVHLTHIIVLSQEQHSILPGLSDLATVMPVVTRFGAHALCDAVVDVVGDVAKKQKRFNMVLIANRLSIWFNLFRRIPPSKLIVISQEDPANCLDFAFLPETIKTVMLKWPDLTERQGTAREEPTIQSITVNEDTMFDDEDTDDHQFDEELASAEPSMLTDSIMRYESPKVKPLSNMTRNQIPVRSPTGSGQKQDGLNVPVKFQPLIEAMKASGKAMISLSDLEAKFGEACERLNMQPPSMTAMIDKAADAGLVIMDKSINYIRFRNRAMASNAINYV